MGLQRTVLSAFRMSTWFYVQTVYNCCVKSTTEGSCTFGSVNICKISCKIVFSLEINFVYILLCSTLWEDKMCQENDPRCSKEYFKRWTSKMIPWHFWSSQWIERIKIKQIGSRTILHLIILTNCHRSKGLESRSGDLYTKILYTLYKQSTPRLYWIPPKSRLVPRNDDSEGAVDW